MIESTPFLSVCCITYNHVNFIKKALDSYLMQETSFPFEINVHDDCSTDGTTDIIGEYENQYPQLIKPIYQSENQFSKGTKIFVTYVLPKTRGKYLALCEGDDYWIDPYKLQKQVDFLEGHPECSMCTHNNSWIINDDDTIIGQRNLPGQKQFFDLNDVLERHPWHTSTIVLRKDILNSIPDWYYKIPFSDWSIDVIAAQHGRIGYIDEVMSIYRIHPGGIWSISTTVDRYKPAIQRYKLLSDYFGPEYQKLLFKTLSNQFKKAAISSLDEVIRNGLPAQGCNNEAKNILNQILIGCNLSIFQKIRLRWIYYSRFFGALGFQYYQENNINNAALYLMMACIFDPSWLRNKGTLSILAEFIFGRNVSDYFRKRL